MAFSVLSQTTPQPAPGATVTLNAKHPLATNLVGAWLFNEGTGTTINDRSGQGNNLTVPANGVWKTDPCGPHYNWLDYGACATSMNTGQHTFGGEKLEFSAGNTWTVISLFRMRNGAVAAQAGVLMGRGSASNSVAWQVEITSGAALQCGITNAGTPVNTTMDPIFRASGTPVTGDLFSDWSWCAMVGNGTTGTSYCNGARAITVGSASSAPSTTDTLCLGDLRPSAFDPYEGGFGPTFVFNKALTAAEILSVVRNPYELFEARGGLRDGNGAMSITRLSNRIKAASGSNLLVPPGYEPDVWRVWDRHRRFLYKNPGFILRTRNSEYVFSRNMTGYYDPINGSASLSYSTACSANKMALLKSVIGGELTTCDEEFEYDSSIPEGIVTLGGSARGHGHGGEDLLTAKLYDDQDQLVLPDSTRTNSRVPNGVVYSEKFRFVRTSEIYTTGGTKTLSCTREQWFFDDGFDQKITLTDATGAGTTVEAGSYLFQSQFYAGFCFAGYQDSGGARSESLLTLHQGSGFWPESPASGTTSHNFERAVLYNPSTGSAVLFKVTEKSGGVLGKFSVQTRQDTNKVYIAGNGSNIVLATGGSCSMKVKVRKVGVGRGTNPIEIMKKDSLWQF